MNQPVLHELMALRRRDLDTRSRLAKEGKLYGHYAPDMQCVHRENAARLDEIIEEHGWPGITLVGPEGCQAAWLIAQHSICTPALQRKFLALLAQASGRGDAPMAQVAFLTDRIRFNECRPQVYGTVLDWDETGELSCEVEDPAHLDARRKAVGLVPFREDLERHRQAVKSEGERPPEDYAAYRRRRREWAASAGWV